MSNTVICSQHCHKLYTGAVAMSNTVICSQHCHKLYTGAVAMSNTVVCSQHCHKLYTGAVAMSNTVICSQHCHKLYTGAVAMSNTVVCRDSSSTTRRRTRSYPAMIKAASPTPQSPQQTVWQPHRQCRRPLTCQWCIAPTRHSPATGTDR